jgi:predicted dehydrogenase/threonine dehydrogenase-like Zn-dependent dehydrogenase|tara:strand:+ start:169 stop:2367 length:2199 start_codon:yes stop_codon:yes gene_type:complete
MKQVVSSSKGIEIIDVPSSLLEKGTVLVEVDYSFISTGTELATLRALGLDKNSNNDGGLLKNISESKELVRKVVSYLRERGIKKTVERVFARISDAGGTSDRLVTLGYSCSGKVVSIGEGVSEFSPGDLVACAGANRATHSELVVVPENLVVPIPKGCSLRDASSVAVGSIAMHGLRQSDARMGEFIGVIGLGLVGLLTARLLKIAGCRVLGLDIDESRVSQALENGIDSALSNPDLFQNQVAFETNSMGLDRCIITASSESNQIVSAAMEATRQKGRVVVLGFVPLNMEKYPFMRKEIEFVSSSSYGPGRYDLKYEDQGLDYPYPYVRWTEKRNMAEYLRLLGSGQFALSEIASEEVPLTSVNDAYDRLIRGKTRSRGIFINYSSEKTLSEKSRTSVQLRSKSVSGKVRLAIVGAGSFVREMHLPNLEKLRDQVEISAFVTRKGANAMELAQHYGAEHASTSLDDILDSVAFDAVLIGTRHDKHTEITLKCLKAGKHVLVEKPLAITWDELNQIKEFNNSKQDFPLLMVGFNRRFSPYLEKINKRICERTTPLVMNYQINTKHLQKDHWQRGDEGGGRNVGEACHIYDLFTFLCNSQVDQVSASSISSPDESFGRNENFCTTIKFKDGSIGNLTYTSLGSTKYPKEICHIFCDQSIFYLNNYNSLDILGPIDDTFKTDSGNKGHFKEIELFINAVKGKIDWPIPLWQQIQATEIALKAEDLINGLTTSNHV